MNLIKGFGLIALGAAMLAAPIGAQVRTVDPNSRIDADLNAPAPRATPTPTAPPPGDETVDPGSQAEAAAVAGDTTATGFPPPAAPAADAATAADQGYERDDLLAAAEGTFGKGAQGLAGMIEKLLKDQGKPNAYIAGREAGGAFVVGARYGSGMMTHRVEGQRKVFWTGPSVGFDVGGDASKVFVLVYNLYDSQDIYKRFPAAEGRLFFVGGFAATYLRRGNVVLIPIRLGVGWRVGANVGYMRFSEKSRWVPF